MLRKKIGWILLTAIMTVGTMSGCGGEEPPAPPLQNSQSEQEKDALEATETELVSSERETESVISTEAEDTEEPATTVVDVPEPYPEILSEQELRKINSVYAVGDTAYEMYTYVDSVADDYAMALKQVASAMAGKADVYNIVIPLSSGITLPDNLKDKMDSSDQGQAIQSVREKMDDSVKVVDIYDTLMRHRNEYIYFRTDHHWTALGAYYAYEQFCNAKGITAESLDSYETMVFDGFLGSFYLNDTDRDPLLGANPDEVVAYLPNMDASMTCTDNNGNTFASKVIYDETKAPAGLKYSCFIAGDNAFSEIKNNELTDNSACIVVKESFGNAFVPFLVDHYQTIYVVDYRYWTGSICDLATEKNVTDIVFINNLSMIRNKSLVGKLYRIM